MIVIRLSFIQKVKLIFGWYVQVEIWPCNSQSYYQTVLGPFTMPRVFRGPEEQYRVRSGAAQTEPTGGA